MSGFSPDPSQGRVIKCRENLCVIAGAGSGKTGTLVAAILDRLAESMGEPEPLSVRNILALTFTEKAAAELRQRLSSAFLEKARLRPGERDFWRGEAGRLDRADIGTIHGYALKLVRENAISLNLPGNLEIEDGALFFENDLRNIFTDWLDEKNEDLLWLLDKIPGGRICDILSRAGKAQSSFGLLSLSADTTAPEPDRADLSAFRALLAEARDFLENGDLNKTKAYYEKVRQAVMGLSGSFLANIESGGWAPAIGLWLALIKESGNWYSPRGKVMKKGLEEAAKNLRAKNDAFLSGPPLARLLSLAGQLPARLGALKRSRGAIDFDDILILARRLLAANPKVRQREIEGRRLIMIDEFQDTNRLQAAILAFLLLDPSDGRIFPEDYDLWGDLPWPEIAPRFSAFGDLKQSIYRFRGAEAELMAGFKESIANGGGAVLALDCNYRSQEPLVGFFNEFFKEQLGPAVFTDHDRQKSIRPALYDGPHALLLTPAGEEPCLSAERAAAQARAAERYLGELFSPKSPVRVDDGRGGSRVPGPGDVAILFRQQKRAVIFREVLEKLWPCQSAFGASPFSYAEVRALLAAFKYLSGMDEEISLAGALRSPLGPVSDESLLALARLSEGGLAKFSEYFSGERKWPELAAVDLEILNDLKGLFDRLRPLVGRVPPVEILEEIVEERKLIPFALLEPDGEERARAITGFLALSRRAGQNAGKALGAAEDLDEMAANWPRKGGGEEALNPDAIKLMTVHASKGLEFPVVIIAESDRRPRAHFHPALVSRAGALAISFTGDTGQAVMAADYQNLREEEEAKERAEDIRLLYVAATRAKDHLVLLGWPKKARVKEGARRSWFEMADLAKEAAPGRLSYAENAEAPENPQPRPERAAKKTGGGPWPMDLIAPHKPRGHSLPVTEFSRLLASPESFKAGKSFAAADSEEAGPGGSLERKERGNLFHAALEKIDPQNPQTSLILKREAELLGLAPGAAELDFMEKSLRAFLESPAGRLWHESRLLNLPQYRELPFRLSIPGPGEGDCLHINGRIDLFHLAPGGEGRIVDYKFSSGGGDISAYEIQMRTYAQALMAAGFSGPLSAVLYFAGGAKPHPREVPLCFPDPLSPYLGRLFNLWPRIFSIQSK